MRYKRLNVAHALKMSTKSRNMADQIYMKTNCHFPQKLTISISAFQLNFNFG